MASAMWFSSDSARTFSVDNGNSISFVSPARPPRRIVRPGLVPPFLITRTFARESFLTFKIPLPALLRIFCHFQKRTIGTPTPLVFHVCW